MYAIVTNVVTPAKISLPIEVLFDSSLNIFSIILVNFTAFKALILFLMKKKQKISLNIDFYLVKLIFNKYYFIL